MNVHPFEARQGNSDIQNHPGHIHMQIGGTEVAALGHQAWMGSRGAWHHNEKYTKVDQWLPWLVQCCTSKAANIVLQCLHNCRGGKMRASQTAILPEHADESFIWRCTGEFAIMKIKVGLALPDMPSTIHEGAHNCSCSQEAFHVQGTHDETEWPRSGNGNSRSSVCFLQLYHLFILR